MGVVTFQLRPQALLGRVDAARESRARKYCTLALRCRCARWVVEQSGEELCFIDGTGLESFELPAAVSLSSASSATSEEISQSIVLCSIGGALSGNIICPTTQISRPKFRLGQKYSADIVCFCVSTDWNFSTWPRYALSRHQWCISHRCFAVSRPLALRS